MSHDIFRIGEVAILHKEGCKLHGEEVTVIGPLAVRSVWSIESGAVYEAMTYLTTHSAYPELAVQPKHLRKRRPPQDWVKLCNLTDIPREVTHV